MSILDDMEYTARVTMAGIELIRLLDEYTFAEDPETNALLARYSDTTSCASLVAQINEIKQLELLGKLEFERQLDVERRIEQLKLLEKYKQAEVAERISLLKDNLLFIEKVSDIPAKTFLAIYPYFDEITGIFCVTNVSAGTSFVGKHVRVLQRAAEYLTGAASDGRVYTSYMLGDELTVRIVPLSRSKLGSLDALESAWVQGLNAICVE